MGWSEEKTDVRSSHSRNVQRNQKQNHAGSRHWRKVFGGAVIEVRKNTVMFCSLIKCSCASATFKTLWKGNIQRVKCAVKVVRIARRRLEFGFRPCNAVAAPSWCARKSAALSFSLPCPDRNAEAVGEWPRYLFTGD